MTPVFRDQTVIVSGGTGQLGQAVSLRFIAQGGRVCIPYHSERAVAAYRRLYPQEAQGVRFDHLDASDAEAARRYVEVLVQAHGPPHVLVNLAGGFRAGPLTGAEAAADLERLLQLNLMTAFNLCRAVLPAMLQAGRGRIVNVGARAGLAGGANTAAYAISKSAVQRLTESLSAEVKTRGINVNCVLPSIIDTPQNRQDMPGADFSRWVRPEQMAAVIAFLASEEASAIHGASIPLYGLS
jgi:NAD(P)-dependent dehydrogenase (short-subunit alcohol dehydrogenase family)